jgi:hypothetical protein
MSLFYLYAYISKAIRIQGYANISDTNISYANK